MADVNDTIKKRENVHGDFRQNAACAQQLKDLFRIQPNWPSLSPDQRESLDLAATKLSRILTGDHNEPDHWHDISGYAGLSEKILTGEYPTKKVSLETMAAYLNSPNEIMKDVPMTPLPKAKFKPLGDDEDTIALANRLSPRAE